MWPTNQKKKKIKETLFKHLLLSLCNFPNANLVAWLFPNDFIYSSWRYRQSPEHLASSAFYACASCGYNFNGQIAAGELYPLLLCLTASLVEMEIAFPLFPCDFVGFAIELALKTHKNKHFAFAKIQKIYLHAEPGDTRNVFVRFFRWVWNAEKLPSWHLLDIAFKHVYYFDFFQFKNQ